MAEILTYEEAQAVARELRGDHEPQKLPAKLGRKPTPDELRRLDDALEAWTHKAPWWVR